VHTPIVSSPNEIVRPHSFGLEDKWVNDPSFLYEDPDLKELKSISDAINAKTDAWAVLYYLEDLDGEAATMGSTEFADRAFKKWRKEVRGSDSWSEATSKHYTAFLHNQHPSARRFAPGSPTSLQREVSVPPPPSSDKSIEDGVLIIFVREWYRVEVRAGDRALPMLLEFGIQDMLTALVDELASSAHEVERYSSPRSKIPATSFRFDQGDP